MLRKNALKTLSLKTLAKDQKQKYKIKFCYQNGRGKFEIIYQYFVNVLKIKKIFYS